MDAQYTLAMMYESGIGGAAADSTQAIRWYEKAAKLGKREACDALKRLGVEFDARAQGETASASVGYSPEILCLVKFAKQGDPSAQNNLGYAFEHGEGVAKDMQKAVKWYGLAAEQGFPVAQFNMGAMLFNGSGVLSDKKVAFRWFRLAAGQGHARAQKLLEEFAPDT